MLFFSIQSQMTRKVIFDDQEKIIDCIMLFKKDIIPEWEDPKNAQGGSLILQLDDLQEEQIDDIWKNLVFSVVGNTLPHFQHINGIRLMDRLKKFNCLKIELWFDAGQG